MKQGLWVFLSISMGLLACSGDKSPVANQEKSFPIGQEENIISSETGEAEGLVPTETEIDNLVSACVEQSVYSYRVGAIWVFLHNAPKRYSPVKTGARVIPSCVDVGPGL